MKGQDAPRASIFAHEYHEVIEIQTEGHLRGTMEKQAIATYGIVRLRKEANLSCSINKTPPIREVLL
jgi:hypothetical protein